MCLICVVLIVFIVLFALVIVAIVMNYIQYELIMRPMDPVTNSTLMELSPVFAKYSNEYNVGWSCKGGSLEKKDVTKYES